MGMGKSVEWGLWIDLARGNGNDPVPHGDTRDRICVHGIKIGSDDMEISYCRDGLREQSDFYRSPGFKYPDLSLYDMRLDRNIIIKTSGSDAAWIDRFEIYKRGSGKIHTSWGQHNNAGWCLSRDPHDYVGLLKWNFFITIPAGRCYPELILKPDGNVAVPSYPTPPPTPRPTSKYEKIGNNWMGNFGRRLQKKHRGVADRGRGLLPKHVQGHTSVRVESTGLPAGKNHVDEGDGHVVAHLVAPAPAKERATMLASDSSSGSAKSIKETDTQLPASVDHQRKDLKISS